VGFLPFAPLTFSPGHQPGFRTNGRHRIVREKRDKAGNYLRVLTGFSGFQPKMIKILFFPPLLLLPVRRMARSFCTPGGTHETWMWHVQVASLRERGLFCHHSPICRWRRIFPGNPLLVSVGNRACDFLPFFVFHQPGMLSRRRRSVNVGRVRADARCGEDARTFHPRGQLARLSGHA
jgi:hypothetical protein